MTRDYFAASSRCAPLSPLQQRRPLLPPALLLLLLLSSPLQLCGFFAAAGPALLVQAWTTTAATPRRSSSAAAAYSLIGTRTPSLQMVSSSTAEEQELFPSQSSPSAFPERGEHGIYHILSREQHAAFLAANSDKLIIMKVFAPWCRACKGLEPKFNAIAQSKIYENLPIVFCDLSIQHNKAFVKELGVLALPSVQFYIGSRLADNFPCGPSKVPILKRKLTQLINTNVDAKTRELKAAALAGEVTAAVHAPTANETMGQPQVSTDVRFPTAEQISPPDILSAMTEGEKQQVIGRIPYLSDLSLADLDSVLSKAKMLTFEAGSVLMREGRPGRTFYILLSGEVEICQDTMLYGDPLASPPSSSDYLGAVINRLQKGDYFGERALITGEPRYASIRATERVTCLAFDKDDFPASCVLSGKSRNTFVEEQFRTIAKDKYGDDFGELQQRLSKQISEATSANQVRGSFNNPKPIRGVDTEDEVIFEEEEWDGSEGAGFMTPDSVSVPAVQEQDVVSLLTRFQMIRQVSQCLNYIVQTKARWGDSGIRARRSMLVSRLTDAQRSQFEDAFDLIDTSRDGMITLLELKTVLQSIGDSHLSDEDLLNAIAQGGASSFSDNRLSREDFIGIMAESEFYHLFTDIFSSLDTENSGFVRAKDLDRVLCGVRDLISDDRKSIIDVEDTDMLIDYEQFSRMMLGSALI